MPAFPSFKAVKQSIDVSLNVSNGNTNGNASGPKPGLGFFRKLSSGSLSVFTSSPQRTRPPSPLPDVLDDVALELQAEEAYAPDSQDPQGFLRTSSTTKSEEEEDAAEAARRGEIDQRLHLLAQPYTFVVDQSAGLWVDAVNFQACERSRSQDRYAIQQFEIGGARWTFTGVFDGHLGDATAEHTAHHMPIIVREFLEKALCNPQTANDPLEEMIPRVLKDGIAHFDNAIAQDVLDLFPGGLDSLESLTDEEISAVLMNPADNFSNYNKARLCLYGTTALVALEDPSQRHLWVATLGDCQAVLASQSPEGVWSAELLTRTHNGNDTDEVERVLLEHPGEPDCVKDGRVLGAIAPFRCIGDQPFKQPAIFTRKVLFNLERGRQNASMWEAFLHRNITPPYISSDAEVIHKRLPAPSPSPSPRPPTQTLPSPHVLVLCTDGLPALLECEQDIHQLPRFVERFLQRVTSIPTKNTALSILRNALSHIRDEDDMFEDLDAIWEMICEAAPADCLDDTTVLFQLL